MINGMVATERILHLSWGDDFASSIDALSTCQQQHKTQIKSELVGHCFSPTPISSGKRPMVHRGDTRQVHGGTAYATGLSRRTLSCNVKPSVWTHVANIPCAKRHFSSGDASRRCCAYICDATLWVISGGVISQE